jgi:hypothetical protein
MCSVTARRAANPALGFRGWRIHCCVCMRPWPLLSDALSGGSGLAIHWKCRIHKNQCMRHPVIVSFPQTHPFLPTHTGHRVATPERARFSAGGPWLTENDPRGSKISNLTRASRRGGPPTRAPPDYCGCRKPGTISPVSATVLEPLRGWGNDCAWRKAHGLRHGPNDHTRFAGCHYR